MGIVGTIQFRKFANTRDLEEINEFRKELGMESMKIKLKKCIKCSKKFESEGNHNRMCDVCRKNHKE